MKCGYKAKIKPTYVLRVSTADLRGLGLRVVTGPQTELPGLCCCSAIRYFLLGGVRGRLVGCVVWHLPNLGNNRGIWSPGLTCQQCPPGIPRYLVKRGLGTDLTMVNHPLPKASQRETYLTQVPAAQHREPNLGRTIADALASTT